MTFDPQAITTFCIISTLTSALRFCQAVKMDLFMVFFYIVELHITVFQIAYTHTMHNVTTSFKTIWTLLKIVFFSTHKHKITTYIDTRLHTYVKNLSFSCSMCSGEHRSYAYTLCVFNADVHYKKEMLGGLVNISLWENCIFIVFD